MEVRWRSESGVLVVMETRWGVRWWSDGGVMELWLG